MRFRTSGRNWEGREWYLAPSLVVLARQIEALHPDPKPGDGTVASKAHDQNSPNSDHRPRPFTGRGIVRAIDAGEDRDADPMVTALANSRDPRIAYIIYEGRAIRSYDRPGQPAWTWNPYTGPNPHSHHFHLSTLRNSTADTDTRPWTIVGDDMAHTHEPPRSDLPRDWADATWNEWVEASGTDPKSRTWDFYREDLSWVYSRVIAPLIRQNVTQAEQIAGLTKRVRALENQSGGDGVTVAQVKALIANSRIVP